MWNARDDRALREILSPELRFRGSTEATERVGPEAFKAQMPQPKRFVDENS